MKRRGPLAAAGLLLGAGLGGFFDGIVFHQLLQWHNMLSARLPPDNLVDAKVNMFWDGVFHASVWVITVAGIVALFRAARRPDVVWDGRVLAGGALVGWGLFNLIEGVVDHQLLGLHHVQDEAAQPWVGDALFLLSGALLAGIGALIGRRQQSE
ncbi:MAG: DUF2243 domain-containing protein [Rubrivivax sp.]|nr:MAG: DUF2243 domain-containing protein [Rubrivivax sp.]